MKTKLNKKNAARYEKVCRQIVLKLKQKVTMSEKRRSIRYDRSAIQKEIKKKN